MDTLNILAGLTGIIGFVFSVWIWIRSRHKVDEINRALDIIRDISGTAIWESQTALLESDEKRLQQSEKILGNMNDIYKITIRFSDKDETRYSGESFGQLIERGIIWTESMIWGIEISQGTTEIWLLTPDLKPDASDNVDGKLINKNLRNGKRYVYFFPDDLHDKDSEIKRLQHNVGITGSDKKLGKQLIFVPLSRQEHGYLFSKGNIILYYTNRNIPPRCFEEIVLTQIPERGLFWQEHSESKSKEFRTLLTSILHQFENEKKKV